MGKQHSKHVDYSSSTATRQNCLNDRIGRYSDVPSSSRLALQDSHFCNISQNISAGNKLSLKKKEIPVQQNETGALLLTNTMNEKSKEDNFHGIEGRNIAPPTGRVHSPPTTGGNSSRLSDSPAGTARRLACPPPPASDISTNVAPGSFTVCCREQDLMNSAEDVMKVLQNLCAQREEYSSSTPADPARGVSKVLTLHVILSSEPTPVDFVPCEPIVATGIGSDSAVADVTNSVEFEQCKKLLTPEVTSAKKEIVSSKEIKISSKDTRKFGGWRRCFACFRGCCRRKEQKTIVRKNASFNSVNPSMVETADEEYAPLGESWCSAFDEKQLAMLIQRSMDFNEHLNRQRKPRSNQGKYHRQNDLSAEWTDDNNDAFVRHEEDEKILRAKRTYNNGSLSNSLPAWDAPRNLNLQSSFAEPSSPLNIVNLSQADTLESNFAESNNTQHCINNFNFDNPQVNWSNGIDIISGKAGRNSYIDKQCLENSKTELSSNRKHLNLITDTRRGVGRFGRNDYETVSTAHYLRRHRHRERNQCRAMRQVARWINDSERQSFEPVDDVPKACTAGDGRVVHNHMHEHYHHHYHHHHYCDPIVPLRNS